MADIVELISTRFDLPEDLVRSVIDTVNDEISSLSSAIEVWEHLADTYGPRVEHEVPWDRVLVLIAKDQRIHVDFS